MARSDDIDALKGDKPIPHKILLKRIFKYVKPELSRFILACFFILINVGIDVIFPLFLKQITNELKTDNPALWFILLLAGGYLVLTIISQVFLYFESMILQKSGQRIIYKLRMEVYEHIQNMSLNQLNEMPVGSLVTRVTNYTTAMSDLFTDVIVQLAKNIVTVVAVFIIMMTQSVPLTGFLCIFVVIIFIASFIFRYVIKRTYTKERRYISDLNAFLSENLSGMKITQLFNQQKRKEKQFIEKNENIRKTRYKMVIAFGLYRPFITLCNYSATALTFFVGVSLGLDSGTILAFYLFLSKFFNPIEKIADQLNNIQKAETASERLFNLLDIPPEIIDKPDALDISEFKGEIEFKDVWFCYKENEWILKGVSFHIKPKQTVAFVGATGAGKTTILSLLVRNFEIQRGQILIDGIDIRNIKVESLRKGIGQMLQDVFLFSGSVKNNITLHDDEFSNDEILAACKYVNADSVLARCQNGLDSEVSERGENFSQGQRQLISFARTVLHKPQILILDEATANIDTETEVLIQESLEKMKNIGTMLVVAHRLSTIQKADQIIVLQHGKIIERGNHQDLLKQKGYYYKLYQIQFNN